MTALSPYAWLITHDELAEAKDPDNTGTTGPGGITEVLEIALRRDDSPRGFARSVFRCMATTGLSTTGVGCSTGRNSKALRPKFLWIRWIDDDHYETY